jgi:N-acetylmuramoyl-L-alanine amidase
MQSKRASINKLIKSNSKVSCHYLIDREGEVIQMVEDLKIAWHAGKSRWKKLKNLNANSIGIELVNKGHEFGYQKYPKKQINKLVKLVFLLKKKYKIKNSCILGHSDIAPLRKKDPGEKFPWSQLIKIKITVRHSNKKKDFKNLTKLEIKNIFFKNLYKIGYRYINSKIKNKDNRLITKAFQRKYLPLNVSGKIDQKSLIISDFLASRR